MKNIFSIIFFLAMAVATSCFAGESADKVKVTLDRVVSILASNNALVEKEEMVRSVMDEAFDLAEMARSAIPDYWAERTKAEQEEFTNLFANLIRETLMHNVLGFSGGEICYTYERVEDGFAVVKAKLVKDGVETSLGFWLSRSSGGWLVTDFSIGHVRMVKEHGSHLSSGIQRDGFGKLIKKLRVLFG